VSDFRGDALPEVAALELGDGYLLEASIALCRGRAGGDIDGDLDRTESGDDERGVDDRSDRGEDGREDECIAAWIATSMAGVYEERGRAGSRWKEGGKVEGNR
jgi:hypothetical protein